MWRAVLQRPFAPNLRRRQWPIHLQHLASTAPDDALTRIHDNPHTCELLNCSLNSRRTTVAIWISTMNVDEQKTLSLVPSLRGKINTGNQPRSLWRCASSAGKSSLPRAACSFSPRACSLPPQARSTSKAPSGGQPPPSNVLACEFTKQMYAATPHMKHRSGGVLR